MPPRLPSQSLQACCAELSSLSGSSSGSSVAVASASPLERALLSSQFLSVPSSCRSFSSSTNRQRRNAPVLKQRMQDWFKKTGKDLKTHRPGQPNYLTGNNPSGPPRPFPSNPAFISQPVLSEEARELIWNKVMVKWEGVKAVSAELGVDQRRVAAVVRMKEVEKDWEAKVCRKTLIYSIHFPHTEPPVSVMIHQKIRLVLKTAHKTHGYKKALRASLIGTRPLLDSSPASYLTQLLTSSCSTTGLKTGKGLLQDRPGYGAHPQLP